MAPSTTNGNRARGHFLLVALVLVTLMSIMLAMTFQPLRTTHQRISEQELIYRGEHLAAGIRRFYLLKGRFPFSLDELIDEEPRLIRRLYADPMTEDGEWTLVYLNPVDREGVQGLDALARFLGVGQDPELNSENVDEKEAGLTRNRRSAFDIQDRQITGIRSKSDEEGFTVREESRLYSDWLFTALPRKQHDFEEISRRIGDLRDDE